LELPTKHVIEEEIERRMKVRGKRGRIRKQLLDDQFLYERKIAC